VTSDSRRFRGALGRFATGVTVVTGLMPDGTPIGVTVNAFTSVSLRPPLVLISLADTTTGLDAFIKGARFAINVLGEDQRHLSLAFATRRKNKFKNLVYETWDSGCPILPGCLANLECTRITVHQGGDHVVVIGEVNRMEHSEDGNPLLYYRGSYARLGEEI
jgi:flavin reductase (DIM6/NTAB) family NADH-FMN oxidoreductase RutF